MQCLVTNGCRVWFWHSLGSFTRFWWSIVISGGTAPKVTLGWEIFYFREQQIGKFPWFSRMYAIQIYTVLYRLVIVHYKGIWTGKQKYWSGLWWGLLVGLIRGAAVGSVKEAELPNGSTGNRPKEHDLQTSKGNAGYPAGRVQEAYNNKPKQNH